MKKKTERLIRDILTGFSAAALIMHVCFFLTCYIAEPNKIFIDMIVNICAGFALGFCLQKPTLENFLIVLLALLFVYISGVLSIYLYIYFFFGYLYYLGKT